MTRHTQWIAAALRRSSVIASASLALGGVIVRVAGAQGSLTTQGLGYPTGQLSARASGTGGALAEMDPWSPINPAAVAEFSSKVLAFQLEPEYRQVKTDSSTQSTTTPRYPLVFAAFPITRSFVASVSASTLLDRSWGTVRTDVESIGADTTTTTTTDGSAGAINDVRLAVGWTNQSWLRLGIGLHAFTGRNSVTYGRSFTDSVHFGNYTQQEVLEFRGSALSAGVELLAPSLGVLGFSYRRGNTLDALVLDSIIAQGRVPDHYGVSAALTKFPGATLVIGASHDQWSSLGPLDSPDEQPINTWDFSAGGEVTGPKFGEHVLVFRAGLRDRTLPYPADSGVVHERSVTFGATTGFANGRMTTDAALIWATRTAGIPISERALTLSLGLTVRP